MTPEQIASHFFDPTEFIGQQREYMEVLTKKNELQRLITDEVAQLESDLSKAEDKISDLEHKLEEAEERIVELEKYEP